MEKLKNIPLWMVKYIPLMTDGQCTTIDDINNLSSLTHSMINTQIELLTKLHSKRLI